MIRAILPLPLHLTLALALSLAIVLEGTLLLYTSVAGHHRQKHQGGPGI